ncbi:MAG: biopolymer transporter ExbD [Deferribacteres bacterium]|nr:biopolymer transporter ExbD [candidate division KSB1 bacterium]MCB9502704.1 biopolymer transporter ExbD [Deferribacteres bacterium]
MDVNKGKKKGEMSDINLTSLVDVCLTLVIIFMVTSPLVMQSGIKISAPSIQKTTKQETQTELKAKIHLQEQGKIQLNGIALDESVFADSLRHFLAASKNKLVVISAEDSILHDRVIAVMDEAKQCGAEKLSLIRRK